MLKVKTKIIIPTLISLLFLFSCNQPPASENNSINSSHKIISGTAREFVYNPAMDPLIVGAAHSRKLGDTLQMKMFEVTLKPGDSVPFHTHPDHSFYVVEGGKIEVRFPGNKKRVFELKPGMGWISGTVTDFGKNIGNTTIKWVETDVYR